MRDVNTRRSSYRANEERPCIRCSKNGFATKPAASSSAAAPTPSAAAALASLLGSDRPRPAAAPTAARRRPLPIGPHFAAKAKHVIYLHMVGGPPQMDLYDYKPKMNEWFDKDLPDSVRMGQRLTTMTSGQKRFPIAPSKFKFAQHGQCGMWVSELLPNTAKMVDDMCFIRSMHTEAINHEPAISYMQTGNQITGRPCLGLVGLVRPGLAEREPADVRGAGRQADQHRAGAGDLGPALVGRLSAGRARGRVVPLRRRPDPVHQQPARRARRGPPQHARRPASAQRDELPARSAIPETHTRIQQYELAFRMQSSVPELTDLGQRAGSRPTSSTATTAKKPGTLRQHGAAGPADGRARRALRADLSQQLGHARQRRRPAARPVPRRRPGLLRA